MASNPTVPTYMFVFRYPEDEPDPTPEQLQKNFARWGKWINSMKAKGIYLGGDPLEDAPAKVLRGPKGKNATDGPFAEAKEVVAGYVMITAKSFAAATKLATGCPAFDLPGRSVEVRQIRPIAP
jgi:hypothetical protein